MGMIRAFKMVPDGASFRRQSEEVLVEGLGAQVLTSAFGPDGRLYFTLWRPPRGRSSLWALGDPNPASAEMTKVKALLAEAPGSRSSSELLPFLGHADRRVRFAAQFELVSRREIQALRNLATDEKAQLLPRLHSLWALGQLEDRNKALLAKLCSSPRGEIRAQAARWAGDLGFDPDNLMPGLLNDSSSRVQMFAAISCGKLESKGALAPLTDLLVSADNKIPVLRHAGIAGPGTCGDENRTAGIRDPSIGSDADRCGGGPEKTQRT